MTGFIAGAVIALGALAWVLHPIFARNAAKVCALCGTEVPAGGKFCAHCGAARP